MAIRTRERNQSLKGDVMKQFHETWDGRSNFSQTTGEGTGSGHGFIDTLERGDFICEWARAKVSL